MKIIKTFPMPEEHTEPWFHVAAECESCGNEAIIRAIDEAHYNEKVLPNLPCTNCGKTSLEVGTGNSTATNTPNTEENA